MTKTPSDNLRSNEQGFVAIIITMMVILVVTLIVIGFASIVRREQRQALDRQLSTQALYAAESGVNELANQYQNDPSLFNAGDIDTCGQIAGPVDMNVEFTCVLATNKVEFIEFGSIGEDGKVFPIKSENNDVISTVSIEWSESSGQTGAYGCAHPHFPAPASWNCPVGVLRVDLVPTSGTLSRAQLNEQMFSAFLYPVGSGGVSTVSYTSGSTSVNQGIIPRINCDSDGVCKATIENLDTAVGATQWHMRVRSIYHGHRVVVGANNTGGNSLRLVDAQIIVDSTGKVGDVLRRVQVRLAAQGGSNDSPADYVLQSSEALCKQYRVIPGQSFTSSNPECSLN